LHSCNFTGDAIDLGVAPPFSACFRSRGCFVNAASCVCELADVGIGAGRSSLSNRAFSMAITAWLEPASSICTLISNQLTRPRPPDG
jgi:hypothetical protein